MKRKDIIKHYKSFFGIEDLGLKQLGSNDKLMIDWAEKLLREVPQSKTLKAIKEEVTLEGHDNKQAWAVCISLIDNPLVDMIAERYASIKVKEAMQSNNLKCKGCGTSLGNYCDRCQHLLES